MKEQKEMKRLLFYIRVLILAAGLLLAVPAMHSHAFDYPDLMTTIRVTDGNKTWEAPAAGYLEDDRFYMAVDLGFYQQHSGGKFSLVRGDDLLPAELVRQGSDLAVFSVSASKVNSKDTSVMQKGTPYQNLTVYVVYGTESDGKTVITGEEVKLLERKEDLLECDHIPEGITVYPVLFVDKKLRLVGIMGEKQQIRCLAGDEKAFYAEPYDPIETSAHETEPDPGEKTAFTEILWLLAGLAGAAIIMMLLFLIGRAVKKRKTSEGSVQGYQKTVTVYNPLAHRKAALVESRADENVSFRLSGLSGEYKGKQIPLKGRLRFGRETGNEIRYPEENVHISRRHCELFLQSKAVYIHDLNSTCGTFVNGNRLRGGEPVLLKPGDRFSLASQEETFRLEESRG